jgi:opacity protein-like surface antigen
MKTLFFLISLFLFASLAKAQDFHLNLFGGASNYQGDLQDKRFTFDQSHLAGGFGLSYDLTDHFSIRSALTFGKVSADDKFGRNEARNLNFYSKIAEASIGLEYFITPIADHALTPYVFAGIAAYHFNPYTFDSTGSKYYLRPLSTEGEGFVAGKNYYSLNQFAVPFGAGVKLSLSDNINVGLEAGFRKLFTDYLDDVSTTYVDQALLITNRGAKAAELAYRGNELKNGAPYPAAGTIRGGSTKKDWYYFTGLTLSFRIGNGDGNGDGSGNVRRKNREYGCPVNVR